MGGSVVSSSVWTSGVSWVSWPSRLPKRHRHQTQILKEQQKAQSQTAQMLLTGQACRRARAMGEEASSPHCLHTTSTQRLPPRRSHHPSPSAARVRAWALEAAARSSVAAASTAFAIAVLDGWCATEQERSPPTFAGAQNEGLRLRNRLPAGWGPGGPSENDD